MEKVTTVVEKDENQSDGQNGERPLSNARYIAVRVLSRHERSDAYLDKLLHHEQNNSDLNSFDKALLKEIVTGVMRWKNKLDWILTGFYRGDYQKCLNIVKNAMRVALYQIIFLGKIPVPAAIYESVEIVKRIQSEKTAGIVNGVLRNIVRNMENVRYPDPEEDLVYYYSVVNSHPKWMVKRWLERYGEESTEKLLTANNHRPNIPLRINTMKATVAEIHSYLENNDFVYYKTPFMNESLRIKITKANIFKSEIFHDGRITIQDTSASLAVRLATPQPGMNVVDLCAAPGGKTLYLAEMIRDEGKVMAVEKYPSKLKLIEDSKQRLGLQSIDIIPDDARTLELDEPADLVFADVPCSGLGTLSKKPDIKWKKEPEDIIILQKAQREIMENAAKLVKPGGTFVYSTCTIEPEENQDNVEWFLENHPEFELDPAEKYLPSDVCKDGYMQTLPHVHLCDGAFAARLVKKA